MKSRESECKGLDILPSLSKMPNLQKLQNSNKKIRQHSALHLKKTQHFGQFWFFLIRKRLSVKHCTFSAKFAKGEWVNVLRTCIWCLKLFHQNPRSVCLQNKLILILKHLQAIMTMVPEAWQDNSLMSQDKQDFYRWISCSMEPWDGPGMYRLDQLLKA